MSKSHNPERISTPKSPMRMADDEPVRRLGFLSGGVEVPEDFDRMSEAQIEDLFGA